MAYKEHQMLNLVTISMSDVINHPWYEKYINKPNGLKALLYTMGLDISLPYESELVKHRSTVTNAVVTCERFSGSERTDDNWVSIQNTIKRL